MSAVNKLTLLLLTLFGLFWGASVQAGCTWKTSQQGGYYNIAKSMALSLTDADIKKIYALKVGDEYPKDTTDEIQFYNGTLTCSGIFSSQRAYAVRIPLRGPAKEKFNLGNFEIEASMPKFAIRSYTGPRGDSKVARLGNLNVTFKKLGNANPSHPPSVTKVSLDEALQIVDDNSFAIGYQHIEMTIPEVSVSTKTCKMTDTNIRLPTISLQELMTKNQPGFTHADIDIDCSDLFSGGTVPKRISAYLSSDHVATLGGSKLKNTDVSATGAKNVGFELMSYHQAPEIVHFTKSATDIGTGTKVFENKPISAEQKVFRFPLGVYYVRINPAQNATAGKVTSSARVVIDYE